jgi:hypothetical protein
VFVHCSGEVVPTRRAQNKEHIMKVVFLAAVACLCYDPEGKCTFDDKIDVFLFVERVAAKNQQELRERKQNNYR